MLFDDADGMVQTLRLPLAEMAEEAVKEWMSKAEAPEVEEPLRSQIGLAAVIYVLMRLLNESVEGRRVGLHLLDQVERLVAGGRLFDLDMRLMVLPPVVVFPMAKGVH
jgi:hypothetical protein